MTDSEESSVEARQTFRCPTCGTEDVHAYEFPDEPRVHIYCYNSDCGWIHRNLSTKGRLAYGE